MRKQAPVRNFAHARVEHCDLSLISEAGISWLPLDDDSETYSR